MSNKTQSIISIVAALVVLFSAMWDPRVSVTVAVLALAWLGIYQFKSSFGLGRDDTKGDPINPEQIAKRRENLDKIMRFAQSRPQITNNDIQHLLGVSDATATRYLEYLVNLNKLTQIGARGQQVSYRVL